MAEITFIVKIKSDYRQLAKLHFGTQENYSCSGLSYYGKICLDELCIDENKINTLIEPDIVTILNNYKNSTTNTGEIKDLSLDDIAVGVLSVMILPIQNSSKEKDAFDIYINHRTGRHYCFGNEIYN